MENFVLALISEAGVVSALFIILLLGFGWALVKYVPKIVDKHFTLVREMTADHNTKQEKSQQTFAQSLRDVTAEHKQVTTGILKQFEKHGDDHEKMMSAQEASIAILRKLDKTQDIIHSKI
ncbi:MAG: hypothetical protein KAT71_08080 [Gammaproteobacteria bacterium]|nr:hypothetical protein [Gammaproteobacteria bacterium]